MTTLGLILLAWGCAFGPYALALGSAAVYDWIDRRRR